MRDRPGGRRLFDILRSGDVLVVRWIDRLGRNYADVTDTIREFIRRGVVIRTVINRMEFDGATTDPMKMAVRDAMIAFMAASAQAQAEATKEAQKAGIAAARDRHNLYRGRRPTFTAKDIDTVEEQLACGTGITEIAKSTGLSRQAIYRIRNDPAASRAVADRWT